MNPKFVRVSAEKYNAISSSKLAPHRELANLMDVPPTSFLCYATNRCIKNKYKITLYFSTKAAALNWGDDWGDIPYEHNAGVPYSASVYHFSDKSHGLCQSQWDYYVPRFYIFSVTLDRKNSVALPHEYFASDGTIAEFTNSNFSVEQINLKKKAWLENNKGMMLFADATPNDCVRFLNNS